VDDRNRKQVWHVAISLLKQRLISVKLTANEHTIGLFSCLVACNVKYDKKYICYIVECLGYCHVTHNLSFCLRHFNPTRRKIWHFKR